MARSEQERQSNTKWRDTNRDKRAAHRALRKAVRRGTIKRKPCEVCGATKNVHGHHDDYTKRLSVRWLCKEHHVAHHLTMRRERAGAPLHVGVRQAGPGRWKSQIKLSDGHIKHLGTYPTPEEAAEAFKVAKEIRDRTTPPPSRADG